MIINLAPQRRANLLSIEKMGDALIINEVFYDFAPIPEGATLPSVAIKSDFIVGDVVRKNGEIELTIFLPHGANPRLEQVFPQPIVIHDDGKVNLP
ncbi:hypothetical protein [Desulfoluna spongiiphila]|uniref:hypothetical protein n=1 Tax=Desulfoluna spongiiphila TaxID=419481 RepID=UPI001258C75F|nr:hypothetical protein [Desulfoluna spongiiphila]VVS92176.1 hypothetical protein DBB_17440 [Desulfoluna spongiiphila]